MIQILQMFVTYDAINSQTAICSGNVLAPNNSKPLYSDNDTPGHWGIYPPPGPYTRVNVWIMYYCLYTQEPRSYNIILQFYVAMTFYHMGIPVYGLQKNNTWSIWLNSDMFLMKVGHHWFGWRHGCRAIIWYDVTRPHISLLYVAGFSPSY